jgi:myo-inositol-1(or 4)-monophosphatase
MPAVMHPMLNTAVKAARRAGTIINRASQNLDILAVTEKTANDYVSEVDRAAEQAIVRALLEAYPSHSVLAEESGASGKSEFQWIIDPLDGTTNFLHGIPQFAISIGLQREGVMIAGLIFNPANDDLYIAERGKGAFLNDQRLRVAGRRKLNECVIACGLPHIGRGDHELSRLEMTEIQDKVAGLRRFGAAALDIAFVASGRLDGYWERNLQPWDMAAGQIILREAGGTISGIEGSDDPLKTGNIICGNEFVHAELVKILKPLGK